jgi:glycosyltransferase involved in cell wall biosynthesis
MEDKYESADNIKVFLWNPSIDHLTYYTWLALQSLLSTPISFVLGRLENEIRKAQAWKQINLDKFNPIVIPSHKLLSQGIQLLKKNPDAIHIFQAFRGSEGYNYFPLIMFALRRGIKVVVLDEAYTTTPVGYFHDENPLLARFKTLIRPWLRQSIGTIVNLLSTSQKPCVLPLSLIAKKQFIEAGFAPDTLFPFGYFVPRQQVTLDKKNPTDTLRIIFVGALIFRKGIDILLDSLEKLHDQGYSVTLDIYGAGNPPKINLSNLQIHYKGTLPFDQIQGAIAEHDILILPSRHDGWGVVVNEALLQGVPVILSNRVGSKCLIESTDAGLVFESENIIDLAEKIKMVIDHPLLLQELTENARKVGKDIIPEIGAQYFLDTLLFYFFKIGYCPSAIWSKATSKVNEELPTGEVINQQV